MARSGRPTPLAVGDERQKLRLGAHPSGSPELRERLRPVAAVVGGDAYGLRIAAMRPERDRAACAWASAASGSSSMSSPAATRWRATVSAVDLSSVMSSERTSGASCLASMDGGIGGPLSGRAVSSPARSSARCRGSGRRGRSAPALRAPHSTAPHPTQHCLSWRRGTAFRRPSAPPLLSSTIVKRIRAELLYAARIACSITQVMLGRVYPSPTGVMHSR